MRTLTVQHHASFTTEVDVADDATPEQIKEAVFDTVPKFPDVKAGVHFDPDEFVILEDETRE